jgi:hypothetical protein
MKIKHQVLKNSVARWRRDNPELDHVAQALTRSIEKPKPEIPPLSSEEAVKVIASGFRLADRLSSQLLKSYWLTVACTAYEQEISPVRDYAKYFSLQDNEAPKTRRGRKPASQIHDDGPRETALTPRSYCEQEEAL